MGQATVDLPDPLEQPPAASPANTDDLLAQLAGDEIDRLLAEADADAPAPAAAAVPAPEPEAPADPPATATVAVLIPPAPVEPPGGATVAIPPAAPVVEAAQAAPAIPDLGAAAGTDVGNAVQSQLDDLLQEITAGTTPSSPTPSSAAAPAPAAIESPGSAPPAMELSAAAKAVDQEIASAAPAVLKDLEAELEAVAPAGSATASAPAEPVNADAMTSAGERRGLGASTEDSSTSGAVVNQDEVDALLEPESLPIYLKPLEWLNAPFDLLPDAVRDVIGKVALLTLFNAVAVLLYVFLIRKH